MTARDCQKHIKLGQLIGSLTDSFFHSLRFSLMPSFLFFPFFLSFPSSSSWHQGFSPDEKRRGPQKDWSPPRCPRRRRWRQWPEYPRRSGRVCSSSRSWRQLLWCWDQVLIWRIVRQLGLYILFDDDVQMFVKNHKKFSWEIPVLFSINLIRLIDDIQM